MGEEEATIENDESGGGTRAQGCAGPPDSAPPPSSLRRQADGRTEQGRAAEGATGRVITHLRFFFSTHHTETVFSPTHSNLFFDHKQLEAPGQSRILGNKPRL